MARIWLELDEPARALDMLEKLFAAYPQRRQQPDLALFYARALAANGSGDIRAAFDAALTLATGPEAKCRYAGWLAAHDAEADRARARALYEDIIADSRYWDNHHARELNREWLQRARQALAEKA
jgi:hypothetical protein